MRAFALGLASTVALEAIVVQRLRAADRATERHLFVALADEAERWLAHRGPLVPPMPRLSDTEPDQPFSAPQT